MNNWTDGPPYPIAYVWVDLYAYVILTKYISTDLSV